MNDSKKPFRIKSYVKRQGRMTPGQARALEELTSQFCMQLNENLLNLDQLFSRTNEKILEIGFGMGEALLEMATHHPEKDFIAVDVHEPGVGALLLGIEKHHLTNIRIFCADVIDVLYRAIPDESLDAVHIFFPDPWPKKRHHKRRLIQLEFLELIRTKLKLAGYIHAATDWEDYANHMLSEMTKAPGFVNAAGAGHFSPRPHYRYESKFEKRGKQKGHDIWDLIFIKKA